MYQHYIMMIPQVPGTPGEAKTIEDGVVGLMTNGVLLDTHEQTWSYDECTGHSDTKHQYHYHLPPTCFLKSMGVAVPEDSDWWMNDEKVRLYEEMSAQWPSTGSSPVVGFARDGFPIKALYDRVPSSVAKYTTESLTNVMARLTVMDMHIILRPSPHSSQLVLGVK